MPERGKVRVVSLYALIIAVTGINFFRKKKKPRVYTRLGLGAETVSPTKQRASTSRKLVLRKLKRQLKKSARGVETDKPHAGWLDCDSTVRVQLANTLKIYVKQLQMQL